MQQCLCVRVHTVLAWCSCSGAGACLLVSHLSTHCVYICRLMVLLLDARRSRGNSMYSLKTSALSQDLLCVVSHHSPPCQLIA